MNRIRCWSIPFDRCRAVPNQPFDKPRQSHGTMLRARDAVLVIILKQGEREIDHNMLMTRTEVHC
jgi:hypothetical protein